MHIWAEQAGYWLLDAFALSWLVAALWSSRAAARPGRGQALYRLPQFLGAALLLVLPRSSQSFPMLAWGGAPLAAATAPWWRLPEWVGWIQVGLIAVGLGFCWWARLHLGSLWSGSVTRKADHRIVETGPYALVRHPIYTGLLLALGAQAASRTCAAAALGLALIALSFWWKARVEERFLRAELGADAYDAYRARTAMLIPFTRL